MANDLSKDGATEALITFIEIGAGINVPIDSLYLDIQNGVFSPEAEAILDYFSGSSVNKNTYSDDDFRHYSGNSDYIFDGYAERYALQTQELKELFGDFGIPGELDYGKVVYDYFNNDLANDLSSNTSNYIELKRKEQIIDDKLKSDHVMVV